MEPFKEQRKQMIREQIVSRGIQDRRVLEAMEKIPREFFVEPSHVSLAYEDTPLPIQEGQTISQPFIVAWMAEQAYLKPEDKVLEIGTGSGYSTAILSQLVSHVYSIERYPALTELARTRLQELGCINTTLSIGDGTIGWTEFAPYDAIIVTAGGPQVPPSLLKQLKLKGRLVIPIGSSIENQQLIRVTKEKENKDLYENIGAVRFVPLIGVEGWMHKSTNR